MAGKEAKAQRREQWEKVKGRPFRERLGYFNDYYRNKALVALAVLIGLAYVLSQIFTAKQTALHVMFVNTYVQKDLDVGAEQQAFLSWANLDEKKQEIWLETGLVMGASSSAMDIQKMAAEVASGNVDAMITNDTYIKQNRDTGMFADLSEVLPEELLEACEERLYYINSTVDEKGEFPVAIDVSDAPMLLSPDLPAYFCVTSQAEQLDNAALFLQYLLEGMLSKEAASA